MSMYGIDVSEHQGEIDWDKVKNQIDFAILRLGWIGNKKNHTKDVEFKRNYKECKRLGIPVGVYVYNYCNKIETVKDGARWVINQLEGKELELPIYFDIEDSSIVSLGKEMLTNLCIEHNNIIESAGLWAGVYANKNWYENYLHKEEIKKRYTTWIATYRDGIDLYKGEYDIWQNSSSGRIDGISGKVDTNYMYRNLINDISKSKNKKEKIIHIVKKGDTLCKIAKKYNTTVGKIAEKNGITNIDLIYIGQRLEI